MGRALLGTVVTVDDNEQIQVLARSWADFLIYLCKRELEEYRERRLGQNMFRAGFQGAVISDSEMSVHDGLQSLTDFAHTTSRDSASSLSGHQGGAEGRRSTIGVRTNEFSPILVNSFELTSRRPLRLSLYIRVSAYLLGFIVIMVVYLAVLISSHHMTAHRSIYE